MTKPLAYIGIDPGMKGSIVCLYEEGRKYNDPRFVPQFKIHAHTLGNSTPSQTWKFLSSWDLWDAYAVIEQQVPRPTRWLDKRGSILMWRSSIIRSTVILYGSYMRLCGMLTASEIPHEECPPQRWQKALCLRRDKKMKDPEWKRLLKTKAQQLYPSFSQEISLATTDALLLTHYVREKKLIHSLDHRKQWQHHEEQE